MGSGIEMLYFTIQLNQKYHWREGVEIGAFASLVLTSTYSQHT
jgi:hypothetical protein